MHQPIAHQRTPFFSRAIATMALLVLPLSAVRAVNYPNPTGFVTDMGNLLTSEERQSLESTLKQFKQQTGNEIAVITVPSLDGEPIEDYAVVLFQKWGIGDKEKDNGLLILVVKQDRAMRIEVGYGLEGVINDAKAGRIIREIMAPRFREEKYGEGLIAAVSTLRGEIAGDASSALPPEPDNGVPKDFGQFFPFLFIFFVYIASFLARSKRWWPGGVVGAIGGGILGGTLGSWIAGALGLGIIGLLLDYFLSKNYQSRVARGLPTTWWGSGGGFRGGGFGGGFGGFGGGLSGGGGASGRW